MPDITVFTPTYNRADTITKLYESLTAQTNLDFLWFIVDDGSCDGTNRLVQKWIDESKIAIRYVYQENKGKCAAFQTVIQCCDTPWLICVDSDDYLCSDAIQIMRKDMGAKHQCTKIGFVYPRRMGRNIEVRWVPEHVKCINMMDLRTLYGVTETAILFQTDYLKHIVFPLFENEKFLSEEVLYIQLTQYGGFVPRKTVFYFSEYQNSGITKNLFKHWVRNPKGTIHLLRLRYEYSQKYGPYIRLRERVKSIMNLNALCMVCGKKIRANTPSKIYSALLFLPSVIWKHLRFRG